MLPKEIRELVIAECDKLPMFEDSRNRSKGDMLYGAQLAFDAATNYQFDFVRIANRHNGFARQTFIDETPFTALLKLKEELKELNTDLNGGDRDDMIKEYADCFFCLISSFGRAGIQAIEILEAMKEKLEVNIKRKWIRNEDGTYSHVKQPLPAPSENDKP